MIKIKSIAGLIVGSLLLGNVSHADFGDALVGGVVGGAVGSVITNEVYKSNRAEPAPRQHRSTTWPQKTLLELRSKKHLQV